MAKRNVYIEPRANGQFAVMKANAKRASALCNTQAQAERKAKQMFPDVKLDVARVRKTSKGHPDQFRKG
jgi:hypothetical protein